MTRTAQQKLKTRRGRQRLEAQRTLYQIRLSGWDITWSLGLAVHNNFHANEGNYHERMILTLRGDVLYPEIFKYPEVEGQLYENLQLIQGMPPQKGIGSMTASGRRLVIYIAVSRERIDTLVSAADRLLALELNAPLCINDVRWLCRCIWVQNLNLLGNRASGITQRASRWW